MKNDIRKKTYLSHKFLMAAIELTKNAFRIENDESTNSSSYDYNVMASIFLVVSFLEAIINEFFIELVDEEKEKYHRIDPTNREVLIELWKKGIPRRARHSILDKFEIAIDVSRGIKFSHSQSPYLDIKGLIKLRNMLIHYEPKWQITDRKLRGASDLENLLKGKFELHPHFDKENEPFFPNLVLSADCALWAIKSASDFVLKFYDNINCAVLFKPSHNNLQKEIANIKIS
ncbi:MAG: hypothetical protein PVF17_02320 [Ignavibacteria bacterium]|jgi:hypothetical protein